MGYTGHLYWPFKGISFQNRNILLLLDPRATHHQDSCYVKYVKIVFFPQNCTTIFQYLTKESCHSNMFICSLHHALVLTPGNDVFLKQFTFFSQERHCHYGTSKVIVIMGTKTLSWPRWQQSISVTPTLILSSHLFQLTLDPAMKLDRWVKKLFHMRQKAINGEPLG